MSDDQSKRICIRIITPSGLYHSDEMMSVDDAESVEQALLMLTDAVSGGKIGHSLFRDMISPRGEKVALVLPLQVAQQSVIEVFYPTDDEVRL